MLSQKDFRESFPEAMKGFARWLWGIEGCHPGQAEGRAHAVHGQDGIGRAECLQGAARSLIGRVQGTRERVADEPRL